MMFPPEVVVLKIDEPFAWVECNPQILGDPFALLSLLKSLRCFRLRIAAEGPKGSGFLIVEET